MIPSKVKDETGNTYGSWTVIEFSHIADNKSRAAYWLCQCVCGSITAVEGAGLRSGNTTQCKRCHGRQQMRHIKYKEGECSDLYIIKCGPYIKIGVTNDIETRLRSLRSANPYPIELTGLWKGEGWREEFWHEALKDCNVHGEWYKPVGKSCDL